MSLLKLRREFDQNANVRPVRLMPGIPSPLAGKQEGDIDFWVVRENTGSEYLSIGRRIFEDTERKTVAQEPIFIHLGTGHLLKFAFGMTPKRPKNISPAPPSPRASPSACPIETNGQDIPKLRSPWTWGNASSHMRGQVIAPALTEAS